jgi:hypothetical protein
LTIFHGHSLRILFKSYDDSHIFDVDVEWKIGANIYIYIYIYIYLSQEKEKCLGFWCFHVKDGQTIVWKIHLQCWNCCLLFFELLSILSTQKNCICEKGVLEDVLWRSKGLKLMGPHNDCTQELMLRSKSSSLFKVLRFVKKFSTKLWVWHGQHICYTSNKGDMVVDSYYMETKGPKTNCVLRNKLCQMRKPS